MICQTTQAKKVSMAKHRLLRLGLILNVMGVCEPDSLFASNTPTFR